MEIVTRELNLAWQPVGLKFALDKREREAQVQRLMPGTEKILCVSFEVRMPEAQGSLNLCLPSVVLNTILRRLISERDRPRRRSEEAHQRISLLMEDALFGGVLQFPPMRLNAGELAALTPGKVLRLAAGTARGGRAAGGRVADCFRRCRCGRESTAERR